MKEIYELKLRNTRLECQVDQGRDRCALTVEQDIAGVTGVVGLAELRHSDLNLSWWYRVDFIGCWDKLLPFPSDIVFILESIEDHCAYSNNCRARHTVDASNNYLGLTEVHNISF